MSKTIEQKKQEISNYLNKASLHLFTNDKGAFMKVIPFEVNDLAQYAYINYEQGSLRMYISNQWGYYNLQGIKSNVFPSGHNLRSIPNFKAARTVTAKIQELLKTYNGSNTEAIKAQVSSLLSEMQIQTTV